MSKHKKREVELDPLAAKLLLGLSYDADKVERTKARADRRRRLFEAARQRGFTTGSATSDGLTLTFQGEQFWATVCVVGRPSVIAQLERQFGVTS